WIGDSVSVVVWDPVSVIVRVVRVEEPITIHVRIASIGDAVPINIVVVLGYDGGTAVAGITQAISVGVRLARVGDRRAVVHIPADPVPVRVIERVVRAGVAGAADAIEVGIGLIGVVSGRAVVGGAQVPRCSRISPPVTVGVDAGLARVFDAVLVVV